jgi:hypothetical protein
MTFGSPRPRTQPKDRPWPTPTLYGGLGDLGGHHARLRICTAIRVDTDSMNLPPRSAQLAVFLTGEAPPRAPRVSSSKADRS